MRRAWIAAGLLIPLSVAALEYRDLSKLYLDAPFAAGEAAGISLLTALGAVEGDPDGNFAPRRTLNRAEFLKIALASYPKVRVSSSDADHCFPDVPKDAWFSPYVCLAKRRGMVGGYPDGLFKPARTVNYAEALKILGELYGYLAYSGDDEPWYMGYVRAAQFHKTDLPVALAYDKPLTRGQMVRLAAAYRAESEGELAMYRLAEVDLNKVIAMQRESSDSSASSLVSSLSSSSSSRRSETSTIAQFFPVESQLILLGQEAFIADGFITGNAKNFVVNNVTVVFHDEPKNLAALYLVDEKGREIAMFSHDTYDQKDRTWKAQGSSLSSSVYPASGARFGLKIRLKERGNGGFAEEILRVKTFTVYTVDADNAEISQQAIPSDTHFPPHQTVQASLDRVTNGFASTMPFVEGNALQVAKFLFDTTVLPEAVFTLEQLTFTVDEERHVTLGDWSVSVDGGEQTICTRDTLTMVLCSGLSVPEDVSDVSSVTLTARVVAAGSAPHFRIDLDDPGFFSVFSGEGRIGSVVWSDGSGRYQWLRMRAPIAKGTEWK
ncbi:S-layer homology domain-containing protein [Candidatus Peregrinibacteria bacterium]|nr:S-layer homology domain-containing protein [Candidatus Peregrinibacteria bacterium]